uniref:Leucine-rich repeat flightless-interacting protein 2 n=2 Tax=Schistocephalus solidus TaxID=70667 RepID=A0A0X3Q3W7_SCHSO
MSSRMQSTRAGITDLGRMAQEAEAQRDAQHQLTFEARKILNEEKERQRQQEEGSDDGTCPREENGQGHVESISSRFSSRQSSLDPTSLTSNSYYTSDARELRKQLRLLEDKYKDVMVVNAQLDGDKQLLSYTVDLLKDKLEDLTESNLYNQRCANERKKDLAYQRMQIAELTHQLNSARQQIEQWNELLKERGLVLIDAYQIHPTPAAASSTTGATESGSSVDGAYPNGDSDSHRRQNGGGATTPSCNDDPTGTDQRRSAGLTLLSKDNAELLLKTPGYDIDSKLAFLFAEQAKAQDKISRLQSHLEEERERVELVQKIDARAAYKGSDPDSLRQNMQTARSQALDYKFRLEQATQKITALEGDIIRLEGQVKRYKLNLDDAEKKEEQLKQDRRKLQRDVREANIQIDELKSENNTLQRKIDKLTRGTLIGSQLRSGSASRTLRDSSQNR